MKMNLTKCPRCHALFTGKSCKAGFIVCDMCGLKLTYSENTKEIEVKINDKK